MHILLITDQIEGSHPAEIEGIFSYGLESKAMMTFVFFSKQHESPVIQGNSIILPFKCRKRGLIEGLKSVAPGESIDIIVVRNWFTVLRQILAARIAFPLAKIGMWESFPQSFHGVHMARQERHGVWRKAVEYRLRQILENRLLARCDFHLFITERYRTLFRSTQNKPWMALPAGIDPRLLTDHTPTETTGPIRFIYTGAIDSQRQCEKIIRAFQKVEGDFILDVYGNDKQDNPLANSFSDSRIRWHPTISKARLFSTLNGYDIGVALSPEDELLEATSSERVVDYCAAGLATLTNAWPEHCELLSPDSAFFCAFDEASIKKSVETLLALPRSKIKERGRLGQTQALSKRDFKTIGEELYCFLNRITPTDDLVR